MKILICNSFHYVRGGADRCALEMLTLLKSKGHEVFYFSMDHPRNLPSPYAEYFVSSIDYPELLQTVNPANAIKALKRVVYSRETEEKLTQLIEITRPDIAHLHNIAHELSPSVLYALDKANIPVVQTMHDYKILCPNTSFLSHQEVCERCKGGKYYQVVRRRCKRDSLPASILACLEAYVHHWLGTYQQKIDRFIAPSKFIRQKMIEFGFSADNIVYLPHMIDLMHFRPATSPGDYVLYFGRLSGEKGLPTLLKAMTRNIDVSLKIAGEGPLEDNLKAFVRQNQLTNVEFVGYQSGEAFHDLIRNSALVVVPSEWYENAPFACYETMALGRPVIGANIGGIPELVQEEETGLLFESGNVDELAKKIGFLIDHPALQVEWGHNARRKVEKMYNADNHYHATMKIYHRVLQDRDSAGISVDDVGRGA